MTPQSSAFDAHPVKVPSRTHRLPGEVGEVPRSIGSRAGRWQAAPPLTPQIDPRITSDHPENPVSVGCRRRQQLVSCDDVPLPPREWSHDRRGLSSARGVNLPTSETTICS